MDDMIFEIILKKNNVCYCSVWNDLVLNSLLALCCLSNGMFYNLRCMNN